MRWQRRYLTVVLALVLTLTGCENTAGEGKPELLEPVSRNSACCPVERGRIGQTEVLLAVVVPTEYAHFYKSDAVIEEIMVEVGDYVKKGEILASSDTREAKKRKKELEEELAQEQKTFVLKEKITAGKQAELRLSKGKDRTDIAVMAEDARYEKQLYEQRVADLRKQIRAEKKKIQAGTLRARHSGYVTFRKNLSVSPEAGANENIVAVADREDLYLELTDQTTKQYLYQDYEVKYILSEGKTYSVKEIPYSQKELMVADRNKTYPPVRLSYPEGAKIASGDTCLVYFREKDTSEVLVVGNDSLHTQGEEYYVYVRGEGRGEEKRFVTIGEQDDHMTEIKGGLKEGEMVCYSSNAAMPVDYKTDTVKRADFEIRSYIGSCRFADASPYVQLADREGRIIKSIVSKGDKVKKGDPLYVVDTGFGEAVQVEISYEIQKEKENFRETMKGIQEQAASERKGKKGKLRSMIKRRWKYERQLAEYTHACALKKLQTQLKETKEGNDGGGRVTIYAKYSGTVENCQIKVGERVSEGAPMLTIRRRDRTRLLVLSIPPISEKMQEVQTQSTQIRKRFANMGESISFLAKGKKYKGICTGYTVFGDENNSQKYPNKVYLTTEKGKSYLSGNEKSGYKYPGYYVDLEKEKLSENPLSTLEATYTYTGFHDVLIIPAKWVHKDDQEGKEGIYYVWRLAEGELVKQYVTLDPGLNDGANQVIFSGLKPGDQIVG